MFKHISFFVLSLFILVSFTSAGLTGTVLDFYGEPVDGITVRLASGIEVATNSSGEFELQSTSVSPSTPTSFRNSLSFTSNSLSVNTSKSEHVSIALYNLRGQKISLFDGVVNAGMNSIPVARERFAAGLWIMRAKIGSETFTQKLIKTDVFHGSWSGVEQQSHHYSRANNALAQLSSRGVDDTLYIEGDSILTVTRPISSYNVNLGTTNVLYNSKSPDWIGFTSHEIDTTHPNYVNIFFSAYDSLDWGIATLDGCEDDSENPCYVLEDSVKISASESELKIEKALNLDMTIRTAVVLDISNSIGSSLFEVKEAARELVRLIIPNQQMSITAFSGTVVPVQGFTSDSTLLLAAIDKLNLGSGATDLYGAVYGALSSVTNDMSIKDKTIEYGNVIVLSDGVDTRAIKTLEDVVTARGEMDLLTVGLGSETDPAILKTISGNENNYLAASSADMLSHAFAEAQARIATIANSFYWLHYRSPKSSGEHSLQFRMTTNSNVDTVITIDSTEITDSSDVVDSTEITDTAVVASLTAYINERFDATGFTSGFASEARDLKITNENDVITGTYTYYDGDSDPEGDSKYYWAKNDEILDSGMCKSGDVITAPFVFSEFVTGDIAIFSVLPVTSNIFADPIVGILTSDTLKLGCKPTAKNVSIALIDTQYVGSFLYGDENSDAQEGSELLWYLNDSLVQRRILGTDTAYENSNHYDTLTIASSELRGNDTLLFKVIPQSVETTPFVGDTVSKSTFVNFNYTPEAQEVKITETADGLTGTYSYYHREGYVEGATKTAWFFNDTDLKIDELNLEIELENIAIGDTLFFKVTPVATDGTFLTGREQCVFWAAPVPPTMVTIPSRGKTFTMGLEMQLGATPHDVTFSSDFALSLTEVTQKEYVEIMTRTYEDFVQPDWSESYGLGDNHPVYFISWYDAVLYTNALSKYEGRDSVYSYTGITGSLGSGCSLQGVNSNSGSNGYRLPTEAEWEYACRAETTGDYFWEWDSSNQTEYAWYNFNSGNQVREVKTTLPNPFGLYDMSGNTLEWCSDWYEEFGESAVADPTGAVTGEYRVMRGGSWNGNIYSLRSGNRSRFDPSRVSTSIGFRVALSSL